MDRFADKYPSLTPYHYAANDPIIFIDVNGDTITVSDELAKKEAWKQWLASEHGQAFFATFRAGGEWGRINVNFTLATDWFPFEGRQPVDGDIGFFKDISGGGNTKVFRDGGYLEALETYGGSEEPNNHSTYSFKVTLDPYDRNFSGIVDQYSTITHETDHVIYATDRIMSGNTIQNADYQHRSLLMSGQGGTQYYRLPRATLKHLSPGIIKALQQRSHYPSSFDRYLKR